MVDLLSTARCNSITSPFHLKRPKWTHSEIKTRAHERRGETRELVIKAKKEAIIMRNKVKKKRKKKTIKTAECRGKYWPAIEVNPENYLMQLSRGLTDPDSNSF